MLRSFGMVVAVSAVVAVVVMAVAAVVRIVRLRSRAAEISKRHEAFGQRFKRSGFAELGRSSEGDTHPVPLGPSS
jgi:ABC-type proline/glycine betaine transport system permease subunit